MVLYQDDLHNSIDRASALYHKNPHKPEMDRKTSPYHNGTTDHSEPLHLHNTVFTLKQIPNGSFYQNREEIERSIHTDYESLGISKLCDLKCIDCLDCHFTKIRIMLAHR